MSVNCLLVYTMGHSPSIPSCNSTGPSAFLLASVVTVSCLVKSGNASIGSSCGRPIHLQILSFITEVMTTLGSFFRLLRGTNTQAFPERTDGNN